MSIVSPVTNLANRGALNMVCPINWLSPLNRGLVSRWLCVSGLMGGSRLIDLCRESHGTLTNMNPASAWQGAKGRPGGYGSLSFDGLNDNVTLTATAKLKPASTITIECWFRGTASSGGLVCQGAGGYRLYVGTLGAGGSEASNKVSFAVYNGTSFGVATAAASVNDDKWHCVQATYDGSTVSIYLDGIGPVTTSLSGTISYLGSNLNFGSDQGGATFMYTGNLDGISIFARTLTNYDCLSSYLSGLAGYPNQLNWVPTTSYFWVGGGVSLTAAYGAFTLTGESVNLLFGHKTISEYGAFTLTGESVNLYKGFTATVEVGSFTLSGQVVNPLFGHKITVDNGSYTLTGQDVNLYKGRAIAADIGSFTYTANSVNLLATRTLTVGQGSFTLSGQAIGLFRGYPVVAAVGSFTLTANSVVLKADRRIQLSNGSYTLTGEVIVLTVGTATQHLLRGRLDFGTRLNASLVIGRR